jgi:hypothetical protein
MARFGTPVRTQRKARLALFGPSGGGKTWTALTIGTTLGEKVAVLDTEHGSAAIYIDEFDFQHDDLTAPFSPSRYVAAINDAVKEGFDVLIIDGLTQAWDGPGGVKEIVDKASERLRGNTWAGWSVGTPEHNKLVEAIMSCPMHIIATMRAKTEWVIEQRDGKNVPVKLGLGPQQRDGMEYEFDLAMLIDIDHTAHITKSRIHRLPPGTTIEEPGEDFAVELKTWLGEGVPAPIPHPDEQATIVKVDLASEQEHEELMQTMESLQQDFGDPEAGVSWLERVRNRSIETFGKDVDDITSEEIQRLIRSLKSARKDLESKTAA